MPILDLSDNWTRFTHNGQAFAAKLERDEDHGAPWDEECGHGDVSEWTTRDKAPGEFVLCRDRRSKRYYDFAGAVAIAKRDGWDTAPYNTGTRGERAARAAMADFENLRAWCNDDWFYVGVIVAPVCQCCDEVQEHATQALWGIESTAGDYLSEVAFELADECEPAERALA